MILRKGKDGKRIPRTTTTKKIKQNKVYCICVLFLATSISTAKYAYNHTEYPETHNIEWGDKNDQ